MTDHDRVSVTIDRPAHRGGRRLSNMEASSRRPVSATDLTRVLAGPDGGWAPGRAVECDVPVSVSARREAAKGPLTPRWGNTKVPTSLASSTYDIRLDRRPEVSFGTSLLTVGAVFGRSSAPRFIAVEAR
ncbi:hypothetical protein Raf01_97210 [Rugosimonospora africana]|uniref:Uncharacterized protein n=1 Tax=Rugosimonospora africana TaxID=556532 RepID=A0A8J3VX58_9ACTN|nr:hypothetical protein Raf01_97210 [Rugosimonospora africana]